MARKLNKTRAMKQLARDASDQRRVFVDRDDLLNENWATLTAHTSANAIFQEKLGGWVRLMQIKHGPAVEVHTYADFDIDYNRYRIGGYVRG